MTVSEARVAVKTNAEVKSILRGIKGYVCQLLFTHEKGEKPRFEVGFHDLNASCIYITSPEDLEIVNWNVPEAFVQRMLEQESNKE